jgi:integrase
MQWALDPGVVAALEWWKDKHPKAKGTGPVFEGVESPGHLADALRGHLALADIDRPELFEVNTKRKPMNVHGLRATFVTLSLANGRSEAWVQDRTGHRSSAMVNRYKRTAPTVAELGLGPLAQLDEAIPEVRGTPPKATRPKTLKRSARVVQGRGRNRNGPDARNPTK